MKLGVTASTASASTSAPPEIISAHRAGRGRRTAPIPGPAPPPPEVPTVEAAENETAMDEGDGQSGRATSSAGGAASSSAGGDVGRTAAEVAGASKRKAAGDHLEDPRIDHGKGAELVVHKTSGAKRFAEGLADDSMMGEFGSVEIGGKE